jgi:glycosyltransferase involved in cell wall biosynthesis
MKPLILHISSDYPDPIQPDKTKAVRNLVEATPEYRHVVYSLNRVNGWTGLSAIPFGEGRIAVSYKALPKGLFWQKRLHEVSAWISADLKTRNIAPDLIEAHKFTVEGLIGQQLATEFSCPLVCDIQGGTDLMILNRKISLRQRYKDIAKMAVVVFPYAPWVTEPFEKMIGLKKNKCRLLPVLPEFDALSSSEPCAEQRLVTIFRLDFWKNKNLPAVMAAMRKLSEKYPALTLDVYGEGNEHTALTLKAMIKDMGLQERVNLKGAVENGRLPQLIGQYSAMVLPSLRETYGLVYAESLFCGVPILYSKDRGIDGYFDEREVGYACNPASVDDIAKGIDTLLTNERVLKQSLQTMQNNGSLDSIRRTGILETYRKGLNDALAEKKTTKAAA